MTRAMDRREFLYTSLTGAGLTLGVYITGFGSFSTVRAETGTGSDSCIPNAWLRISSDNTITILVSRSEMGQGVFTSMPMIVAEELEADWNKVRVEASPTGPAYVDPLLKIQITGGSMSVRNMFDPLRAAGASAREMLRIAASREWNVPLEECTAIQGTIKHKKSGRTLTYGELCSKASKVTPPENPKLKKESEFKLIGHSIPRLDSKDKVDGKPLFGVDVFQPGMVYAVVERAPAYGAKLVSAEREAAGKVPGVTDVIELGEGLAVCAKHIGAALKGREALKAKWSPGSHPDLNNERLEKLFVQAMSSQAKVAKKAGDAKSAQAKAAKRVKAEYVFPYVSHVPAEPPNCTAYVQAERCDIWCPTQSQTGALFAGVKASGLTAEQVHVHSTYLGGGFGRRTDVPEVGEAVEISRAVGKPVKLLWTRSDDIKYDFFRPGSLHRIEGGLDGDGRVLAWSHKVAVSSIAERAFPAMIEKGIDPSAVEGLGDQDYEIPHIMVEWYKMNLPIPVGFWRSVGHSSHAFAVECFIDELASAAGKDPLAFRLQMLKEKPYATGVLRTAAEKAGWGKPLPPGSGRGIAQHASFGSHVAYVAEVSVNKNTGVVKVNRVVCAVDCGPVVNPDTVKAQMEGATCMALSVALKEEIRFEHGGVKSSNFDNYPLLTISEAPDVEVYIVKSDHKRGGIGEPGIPPLAPAVGNAVFAASGIRLRRLPMTPGLVKKALSRS